MLVTGASSGIGQATALHLAKIGFHVFAGIRREEDGRALVDQGGTPELLAAHDPPPYEDAIEWTKPR